MCQLTQAQLSKVLFPIGHLQKAEVREIAAQQDLITANKKDSQGLCFIGKVRLPDFLQQRLAPKKGAIIEIPEDFKAFKAAPKEFDTLLAMLQYHAAKTPYHPQDGQVVGKHDGAHYFTKGQRKGLRVGGTVEPLFVLDTDVVENIIYTGQGKQHPGLYRRGLLIKTEDIHWLREDLRMIIGEQKEVLARIRYRQPLEKATLFQEKEGLLFYLKSLSRL